MLAVAQLSLSLSLSLWAGSSWLGSQKIRTAGVRKRLRENELKQKEAFKAQQQRQSAILKEELRREEARVKEDKRVKSETDNIKTRLAAGKAKKHGLVLSKKRKIERNKVLALKEAENIKSLQLERRARDAANVQFARRKEIRIKQKKKKKVFEELRTMRDKEAVVCCHVYIE